MQKSERRTEGYNKLTAKRLRLLPARDTPRETSAFCICILPFPMFRNALILFALAIVVGLPFALRPKDNLLANADER